MHTLYSELTYVDNLFILKLLGNKVTIYALLHGYFKVIINDALIKLHVGT